MSAGPSHPTGHRGPHVIVVGAVNVDLVVTAARLPGPGETVIGGGLRTFGGGKGANAAVAAARMGADVRLIASVGDDDHGRRARDELGAEGVDVSGVAVLGGQPTGVALIVVDERGDNQIALGPGANGALTAGEVMARLTPMLAGAGCVLVSTEIPGEAVVAAVGAATGAGVPCLLDPAPVIPAVAELLVPGNRAAGPMTGPMTGPGPMAGPVLTPNATELIQLSHLIGVGAADGGAGGGAEGSGATGAEGAQGSALAAISALTGAPAVVTLGAQGCTVAWPDGPLETFGAPVAAVRDTTGAGDTFNGVLAARLAAGAGLGEAVADAVVAAALSVRAEGARTAMPTAAEVAEASGR